MTTNVELTPRRTLAPDELKRLGAALESWFANFLRQRPETDGWIDQDALDDLLAGELPKLQPFIAARMPERCRPALIKRLAPQPAARTMRRLKVDGERDAD